MKVFLTGAGGVMGRSALTALLSADHEVVGLARTARSAELVAQLGATAWRGDLYDADALAAGLEGCDAVVNLATRVPVGRRAALPSAWRDHDRLRTLGSARVVEAARAAGVARVVQPSLSMIYADAGDDWIDELSPIDLTRATERVIVAEAQVDEFTAAGGEGVVLRFGLLTGPDPTSEWMLKLARAGRPFMFGAPESWAHVVHVDDVGTSVVAALTAPAGTYNVGADPVLRSDLADAYAVAAGRFHGRFFSAAAQRLGGTRTEMATRNQRVSSQRLTDVAGWVPAHPKVGPEWFDAAPVPNVEAGRGR